MVAESRLVWRDRRWLSGAPEPENALIIDSFLVDNGYVRAFDAHARRFTEAVSKFGFAEFETEIPRFWKAVKERLPRLDRWFPRVEAHVVAGGVEMVLWLRNAPAEPEKYRLWVPTSPDPRAYPQFKGPDLAVLAQLREEARSRGAVDAALTDSSGTLIEAAHSALFWWEEQVLCTVATELPVFPSVTAQCILTHARAEGVEIKAKKIHWQKVTESETWAVNALHGIRPVRSWYGDSAVFLGPEVDDARLDVFRSFLTASARPLGGP